jgi:hypothetical protein
MLRAVVLARTDPASLPAAGGPDSFAIGVPQAQEASGDPANRHAHAPSLLVMTRRTEGPIARLGDEAGPHGVLVHCCMKTLN